QKVVDFHPTNDARRRRGRGLLQGWPASITPRCANLPDMEGPVQGGMVTRETSNGQTLATMITLTSADQQSRCRTTVRRHRDASLLRRESKSQGRFRGLSVHSALSSFALPRHPENHAALTTST